MANVLSKALKTDLNPPTISDPTPDLLKKQTEATEGELAAGAKVAELEAKKTATEAANKAQLESKKVKTTENLTAERQKREEPLLSKKKVIDEDLMNNHFEPTQESLKDQAMLFSLINVIGFAIGAGGKKNAQQAMYAMNGMLEGHQQGRADLYKTESARFDKNFKALQQRAVFLENELRRSLQDYTRDKVAGDERAHAAFAEAEADFMKVYAEKNGLVKAYERAKEIRKSIDKAIDEEKKRKERREDKADADYRHRELIVATRVPKETSQEKREGKMGTAGPARTIYERTGKTLPDEKTAKEVQANSQGIRAIEDLQKDLTDPEIKAGLLSKTAPFLEKLDSIFNAPDNADFETAVNKQLTGTDKTTLFLKKALLNTYAIERAAKGGQRLTVQDMKMVGPVLDPTNYTTQAYFQLLDDRRKDLYNTLSDYGFGPEDVKKLSVQGAYTPYGQSAPSAPSPEPTQKTQASVVVNGQTFTRPANFSDQQWADYKKAVGAK
jgi:hypothetical protein